MFPAISVVALLITFALPDAEPSALQQLKDLLRAKRDGGNNIGFGFNDGFSIPGLSNLLQQKANLTGFHDEIGSGASGSVDTKNPSLSLSRGSRILGFADSQTTLNKAGARGNGNFGAGFGQNLGIFGNRFGFGDTSDVNVNKDRGLDIQNQRGATGLFTQKTGININPQSGGGFGLQKTTCIAEFLFPGLCYNTGGSLNLGKK